MYEYINIDCPHLTIVIGTGNTITKQHGHKAHVIMTVVAVPVGVVGKILHNCRSHNYVIICDLLLSSQLTLLVGI